MAETYENAKPIKERTEDKRVAGENTGKVGIAAALATITVEK